MIALSVYRGRRQNDQEDYFVGGRNLSWWSVGLSTMATQTSAVSFISIPAFVALKPGGGLTWLQYELALPLAMIAVMVLLIPFFRRLELVSMYAYLEMRYGPSVRTTVGLVFLISRWIELNQKNDLDFQSLYDHWILGLSAEERKPRWSVIRNVLHWVECRFRAGDMRHDRERPSTLSFTGPSGMIAQISPSKD
ncbi:MAG: hypothetical protein PVF55_05125 [Desulfobacterales bacterium]